MSDLPSEPVQPVFGVDVAHNPYLAPGASEVNAIVTVSSTAPQAAGVHAAEVIIVDCSASMHRPSKLNAAKRATIAAIDALRDGIVFAVVAGNDEARLVYPKAPEMAIANDYTKAAAREAVAGLTTSGGTALGRWLELADHLFASHHSEIRHAILLTDGRNASQSPEELAATLAEIAGRFVCDCRGVGTDWEVAELRQIASALLGSVDIVAEPVDLEADFRAMTKAAMSKAVAGVALRLWTPHGAQVRSVRQVAPTLAALSGSERSGSEPRQPVATDYPTGTWGSETRAYHVCVCVEPARVGDKMLACRASVTAGGTVLAKGNIVAIWTGDAALSTPIDPTVAHYTGQAELADAIREGLAARKAGLLETATAKLGRAVAVATASGHDETAALLAGVVDIADARSGTVRLKKTVAAVDEMTLDTRSTVTKRVR